MTILSTIIAKATKGLLHSVRKSVYDDMAHQAADWSPEETTNEPNLQQQQPIRLDFSVPKNIDLPGTAGRFSNDLIDSEQPTT